VTRTDLVNPIFLFYNNFVMSKDRLIGNKPSDEGDLIPHNVSEAQTQKESDVKTGPDDGLREAQLEEIIFPSQTSDKNQVQEQKSR